MRARVAIVAMLAAAAGFGQNPIKWSFAKAPKQALRLGEAIALRLEASIDPGWHLYALDQPDGGPIATEIALAGDSPFALGPIRASKPIQIFDPNFNMRVQFYTEKAWFQLPVTVSADAAPGPATLVVSTRYQSCNDRICLPPKKVKVELSVSIAGRR